MHSSSRRRPLYYILEGKTPVPADVATWGCFFVAAGKARVVADTELPGARVSTVFMGIDTQSEGPPELFETMADHDGGGRSFRKYATWEEAEAAHWELVKRYAAPLN
jgi:hypothetical protein